MTQLGVLQSARYYEVNLGRAFDVFGNEKLEH
jgi:hypothetical protein